MSPDQSKTSYQPKRVFKEPLNPSGRETAEPLAASQRFGDEAFFPAATTEEHSEGSTVDLATVIRPKKKVRWFRRLLGVSFLGLAGWQAVDSVLTAYHSGDWLMLGWVALLTGVGGAGVAGLLKEYWTLRSLKQHFNRQAEAEALIQTQSVGQATELCLQMIQDAGIQVNSPFVARWENHLNEAYNDAEIFDLFDLFVLKTLDEKAIELISRHATESAALVAVSPLAITDMLLVAWRNLSMINRLSDLYGVRLGYWARIRLLRSMFINMAAAGASEIAIDAGMDLLSTGLAGKFSARAGQGVGIGILTARLGLQAVTLLRPLPWIPERKARLASVRKAVVSRVLGLLKPSRSESQ